MKKIYEEPSVEVTVVGTEDVILASGPEDTNSSLFFDVNSLF